MSILQASDSPYNTLHNTLNFPNYGNAYTNCVDPGVTGSAYPCKNSMSPWQYNYKFITMGHIQDLGYNIGPLNHGAFKFLLHELQDPAYNPYLVGSYVIPTTLVSTNDFYQAWGDLLRGFSTSVSSCGTTVNLQTYADWYYSLPACGSTDYPHMALGAASFLVTYHINDGALLGANAWTWISTHVTGSYLQWDILPR
jgi:hypothetical protein